MAVFKCKMCGGTVEFEEGATVGVCDSCGTKQTLPKTNDDEIANLFNRANNLRLKSEFDKALAIYEKIVERDDSEAEAHWGIVLCKYGIEYVDDPSTGKKIPTCHRTLFDAVTTDADYQAAIDYSDTYQQTIYESEARTIDKIQKDILEIVKNEKPFDVFICYKETDSSGKRTVDSAIANDIYYELTEEGFKVFYAAITLEDKLGQEYEPYIFAALNSAKVMLVVGSKIDYFNAVWVRNEWSRFMKLMKNDRSKLLIPCYKDMDAYELPEEFSHLQAQDMSKIGFINDVVRGIKKVLNDKKEETTTVKETVVVNNNANAAPLLERVFLFLEDGKWQDANTYCEKVLDIDPKNAEAYLGKLMAELQVSNRQDLANCEEPFDGGDNYQKVIRFGDEQLEAEMRGYITHINERIENARLEAERLEKRIAETVDEIAVALKNKQNSKMQNLPEERLKELQFEKEKLNKLFYEFDIVFDETNTIAQKVNELTEKIETLNNKRNSLNFIQVKEKKEIDAELAEASAQKENYEAKHQEKYAYLCGFSSKEQVEIKISDLNDSILSVQKEIDESNRSDELIFSYENAVRELRKEVIRNAFMAKYPDIYSRVQEDVDTIFFGKYPQEPTGQEKTPIKWRIIANEGNKTLVVSKYALDCQKFNTSYTDVTWETCTLRSWLNSDFLDATFTDGEQAMIHTTNVSADSNPEYDTDPGNDTEDKVFLLSIDEVEEYFSSDEDSKCVPTEYAIAQGAYTSGYDTKGGKATWWWLRSPGEDQIFAADVYKDGSVHYHGANVYNCDDLCVRPAMWIIIE